MATDCGCPDLDPKDWDLKRHDWQERAFYVTKHRQVLHMPLGIERAIATGMDAIRRKGYRLADPFLMLDAETGLFSAKMMLALGDVPTGDPEVEVIRNATLYSKYFRGEFKDLGQALKLLLEHVRAQQLAPKQLYSWYATCPKCWATKGKETVLFAQV
jgi:hypothetical protein